MQTRILFPFHWIINLHNSLLILYDGGQILHGYGNRMMSDLPLLHLYNMHIAAHHKSVLLFKMPGRISWSLTAHVNRIMSIESHDIVVWRLQKSRVSVFGSSFRIFPRRCAWFFALIPLELLIVGKILAFA